MSDSRQRLESLATDAIQHGGLSKLSFRALADAAGIKSSSVHYYFPEKSDLAARLIDRYTEEFFGKLENIESSRAGLRRKLTDFIALFEDVQANDQLCLCGMMAAEMEQLNEENKERLRRYFTAVEDWLKKLFDRHGDEISCTLSSTQLATSLLAGLEGALLLDRVAGNGIRLAAQKKLYLTQLFQ